MKNGPQPDSTFWNIWEWVIYGNLDVNRFRLPHIMSHGIIVNLKNENKKETYWKVHHKWLVRLNFHSSGIPTFIFSYWLQCMKWILLYFDKLQTSRSSSLVITYITIKNASLKSFCTSLWELLFTKNVWKCPSLREKKGQSL